jgi:hypothetical protein
MVGHVPALVPGAALDQRLPPNILRTALVSGFAPSTTTRVPPLVSRPALEQIGEQPGDHGRVLGVALIEATGTLVPPVVIAKATTIRCPQPRSRWSLDDIAS